MGTVQALGVLVGRVEEIRDLRIHAEGGEVSLVITPHNPDVAMLAYQAYFKGVAASVDAVAGGASPRACRCGPDGCADSQCPGRRWVEVV